MVAASPISKCRHVVVAGSVASAILADSSVWIDYLAGAASDLPALLNDNRLLMHPAVVAEVALGSLHNRQRTLGLMQTLAEADVATDTELLQLVHSAPLHGRGIGWIDAHLVASAILSNAMLLTRDRRLAAVAKDLGIAAKI